MPHLIVKLATGKSQEQKTRMVETMVKDVMNFLNVEEGAISVAVEEIKPEDWTEKVYKPDIQAKWDNLYKKPGYDPLKK